MGKLSHGYRGPVAALLPAGLGEPSTNQARTPHKEGVPHSRPSPALGPDGAMGGHEAGHPARGRSWHGAGLSLAGLWERARLLLSLWLPVSFLQDGARQLGQRQAWTCTAMAGAQHRGRDSPVPPAERCRCTGLCGGPSS